MGERARLVFVFAGAGSLVRLPVFENIMSTYPSADIIGCSAAGEIIGSDILDNSVTASAISFDNSIIKTVRIRKGEMRSGREIGETLASRFDHSGLVHIMIFADGMSVNGAEMVTAMWESLPYGVAVTGGLATGGIDSTKTRVFCRGDFDGRTIAAAVGFYGDRLKVGYGSRSGWSPFGPPMVVTRSEGNVIYELDGRPALDVYKKYLGDMAAGLPASGSLIPLSLREENADSESTVSAIAVDHEIGAVAFSGAAPEGSVARLMKASPESLVDAAEEAARESVAVFGPPDFALLAGGVGRRAVLKHRTEEEIEAAGAVFGERAALAGFYSCGEISPASRFSRYEVKSQTMSVTTFTEM